MRFLGKSIYHPGPGGIEKPGDFGWKISLAVEQIDGVAHDKIVQVEFAMHCRKFGVCLIRVHQAPPDEATATWQWDGNWEAPTIRPSIGCDGQLRCGSHRTVIRGVYEAPLN